MLCADVKASLVWRAHSSRVLVLTSNDEFLSDVLNSGTG